MDLFWRGRTITAIFLFFVIILPLGIVAQVVVVDRPNWDEADWARELEIDRQKHRPDVKGGADGPIPRLVKCAFNEPKKFPRCFDVIREALQYEIQLRKQFKSYNEDCNSAGTEEGELVVNPPKWQEGLVDFYYFQWQKKLINSKLQFCDPHKHLRCSTEKKCVCVSGSVRVGNVCVYSHGFPCTGHFSDLDSPSSGDPKGTGKLYFDPFRTIIGESSLTVEIFPPGCLEKSDKCIGDFLTLYHRDPSYCVNERIFRREDRRFELLLLKLYFDGLRPLPFNEKCNFQDHNRLFTSTKQEDENNNVRFETLEEFKMRGSKFCDLEKFLICGPSEKCECMSPSIRIDNKCVIQLDKCTINAEMEPILMNKTLVPKARDKLMVGFVNIVSLTACEEKSTCQTDMTEVYCTCPPGTTGLECDKTLTHFLSIVRVPSLPTDVAGYPAKIKIFSHFNKKVLEFERLFRWEGTSCHWESQNSAEILVGRIQPLMYRGTIMIKRQYEDLSKLIGDFTNFHRRHRICNETMRCRRSTRTCVQQTRQSYLEDLVNVLNKSRIFKCNVTGCSNFLEHVDGIMYGRDEVSFYGGDHEREYNRLIEEHFKFCLGCQFYKSVAHYCHLPNHFVLLLSVAMVFVVSNG